MSSPPPLDLVHPDPDEARRRVREALPYCGAYLLVDRVLEASPARVVATWTAPSEAPHYRTDARGGALLLPGTVATEHAVQTGELLILLARGGRPASDGVPVLARIERARFRRMIPPGATLTTEVTLTEVLSAAFYVAARVRVEDKLALDASLVFTATQAISGLAGDAR
jgi:3-hydroxyacyl-[acyl-carrier-protein] dehydratase